MKADLITDAVCHYYLMPRSKVFSGVRKFEIQAVKRRLHALLTVNGIGSSMQELYSIYKTGNKAKAKGWDHSSVIHANKVVSNENQVYPEIRKEFEELSKIIAGILDNWNKM